MRKAVIIRYKEEVIVEVERQVVIETDDEGCIIDYSFDRPLQLSEIQSIVSSDDGWRQPESEWKIH